MPTRRKGLRMRNVNYMKPAKFRDYMTIMELAHHVKKDISWLRRLEQHGRIPKASRTRIGQLQIRLWSPEQVREIEDILSKMRVGRPRKENA